MKADYKKVGLYGGTTVAPTNAYVASEVIGSSNIASGDAVVELDRNNQVVVYIQYTQDTTTSLEIKFEFSRDGVNFIQESIEETTTGSGSVTLYPLEYKLTSSDRFRVASPIKDRYFRVSVKATGAIGADTFAVEAIIGTV